MPSDIKDKLLISNLHFNMQSAVWITFFWDIWDWSCAVTICGYLDLPPEKVDSHPELSIFPFNKLLIELYSPIYLLPII